MNKILVLGVSGAGKSTLSRNLGNLLEIKETHLDKLFWEPNWKVVDREVFQKKLDEVLKRDKWIIDGNHGYNDSLLVRASLCDTIIFLNFNRFVAFWGAVKRRIKYNKNTRPCMIEGNNEKIDFEFAKYILWDYHQSKKKIVKRIIKDNKDKKKIIILNNRKQVNRFLDSIKESKIDDKKSVGK